MGTGHDRRTFIRRATVATGAAWVAPLIVTTRAGAAPVIWLLELDFNGVPVITTTSGMIPACEPTGWTAGQPALVNGVDLNWTIVFTNGLDATQGMTITFTDLGAVVIEAVAEETCSGSSPPGQQNCIAATPLAVNQMFWPDDSVPEACGYDVFRFRVQTGS